MKTAKLTPEELGNKIREAIVDVSENGKTIKETGILKLLSELNEMRENPATRLGGPAVQPGPIDKMYLGIAAEWKQASDVYMTTKKGREEYLLAEANRATRANLEGEKTVSRAGKGGGRKELSDSDVLSGPSGGAKEGRVRATKSEKKIPKPAREKGDRDRKTYKFMGEEHGKGKLVLAIIKYHVEKNPKITAQQLKGFFPDQLLKGYGIIRVLSEAQEISKTHKRFFLKEEQLVKVKDGKMAVCNQFSAENIKPFFEHVTKKLGYEIEGI